MSLFARKLIGAFASTIFVLILSLPASAQPGGGSPGLGSKGDYPMWDCPGENCPRMGMSQRMGMGMGMDQGKGQSAEKKSCGYRKHHRSLWRYVERTMTVDEARSAFAKRLERKGSKHLKVGKVTEKDADTLRVEIVTVDDSLAEVFEVDRKTGRFTRVE